MVSAQAANRSNGKSQDVEMDMLFSFSRDGATYMGTGVVRHLTNSEVRVESDQGLPVSGEIELRVKWPFLLQSACPLELVIAGSMTGYGYEQSVVSITSYEFRTCGQHSFEPVIARGMACDLIA